MKKAIFSKKMIYTLCFFALMLIDWTRGSQVGSTWAWTVNMTGVVMAILLATAYEPKSFLKPVYMIYSGICIAALPIAYWWWNLHQAAIYRDKLLTAVINVWLLGIFVIRLFRDVVVDKVKTLKISKMEWIAAAMLLWMFLSVNEDVWPLWYFVMFGLLYHTDYNRDDVEALKQGMLNGIIAGFFALQGAAFIFRPFDDGHHRYCGIYGNCNINALFYCVVWVALLLKLFCLRKSNEKKWKIGLCFLFIGALIGFMILTISKTAWVSAAFVGLFYIIFADFFMLKQKAKKVTVSMLTLVLVVCISVPVCYSAVRYIPPVFHHPVWYDGEYSEDKVHSFDPWDSEKYVSYEEMINGIYTRVMPFIEVIYDKLGLELSVVHAFHDIEIDKDALNNATFEQKFASTIGRVQMWKYYLEHGTMLGHLNTEGHDIGQVYYVWHAQNMFVQLWYYYGIPSAILFVIVGIGVVLCSIRKILSGNQNAIICLLYLVLFGAYGLFECVWYPGQMILFLAFFTPKFLIGSANKNNECSA